MSKSVILKSFYYAFKGLQWVFRERNFKLHLVSIAMVLILGFWCNVSPSEWYTLLICIGAVIGMETANTAIEKLVDIVSPEHSEKAGEVKDIAAAAVLLVSFIAAIIGAMIFIPYFVN